MRLGDNCLTQRRTYWWNVGPPACGVLPTGGRSLVFILVAVGPLRSRLWRWCSLGACGDVFFNLVVSLRTLVFGIRLPGRSRLWWRSCLGCGRFPTSGWLAARITDFERQGKEEAIAKWRARLDASEAGVLGWIRKREWLCVEMERPKLGLEQVHVSQAVHPTKVLASAEESWMRLWGRQGSTGKVESLLAAHPQLRLPGHYGCRAFAGWQGHGRQGGGGWSTAAWCLLPLPFWEAMAFLWQTVIEAGICGSMAGSSSSRSKPTAGHRPLTILPCIWRLGTRILIAQLGDWINGGFAPCVRWC